VSDPVGDAVLAALAGELVIIPTDTVYGIATRPDDPTATSRRRAARASSSCRCSSPRCPLRER
jgi:tRNA A37 threonylcarbamoyladenosine synthetase subunit TsaC/SUA5/YrdC